jgi:hypothetical protein
MRAILRWIQVVLRWLAWAGAALLALALSAWVGLATYYSNLPAWLGPPLAVLLPMSLLAIPVRVRPRWRALAAFAFLFVVVLVLWLLIPPSNERAWQNDVAVLPACEIEGDKVTIHNIRNCDYRSETDYTAGYYDRAFDLTRLKSVDLFVIYWGSPNIAHTMLSFGFDGDGDEEYVCISIETRKEKGEEYSTVKGFFKQYELTYVLGDERDLVRLRTNFRGEDVYLYRLQAAPDLARKVFLDYLRRVNSLAARPEWYNALTSNCTSNIRGHTQPYTHGAWSWKLLINGYIDELAYEMGAVDRSLPFAELKARSRINERARAAGDDPAFSRRLREGLPGIAR